MVDPTQNIDITVAAGPGDLPSSHAVSIGLIVTELIINAVKHAFPKGRPGAQIEVTFEMARSDWKLMVCDNGVGRPPAEQPIAPTGLGTVLVAALAKQLSAQIAETAPQTGEGLMVTVSKATFQSTLPKAA